jgi:putative ABC transport system ATP-binding protein
MGPSGSGKSSLLYLLSGLKRPTAGDVELDGRSLHQLDERALTRLRRERFGFVFQSPFLLNYLTARENVLVAATSRDSASDVHADELFDSLGIASLADRFPHHLSGGERQRVCVARAMINRPDVIFADEPTAALDHANGHIVIDLLASYRDKGAVIVVTHDPEMVADADHVIRMRDGRIEGP